MPVLKQPTLSLPYSIPGEDDLMPPFRACDFNHPSPRTITRMLELEPILDTGDADGEETGSTSSDQESDDQSEQAEDTPCTSQATPCTDEGDAAPQSGDASANELDMQAFHSEEWLSPFVSAPSATWNSDSCRPPALRLPSVLSFTDIEDSWNARATFNNVEWQVTSPAQSSAGPSFIPYDFHHGYPSDVSTPIVGPSLPNANADTLGLFSDQKQNEANVDFADLNLATQTNYQMAGPSYDGHLAAGGFPTQDTGSWQSSGVLPRPQDFASPYARRWYLQLHASGSSAVPSILPPSEPGIVAPRPQRAWDTPTVLSGSGIGSMLTDAEQPNVSAPAQLSAPSSVDGPPQSLIAQTYTSRIEAETRLQCSYTHFACEYRSATIQTSIIAPTGPQRTLRPHARLAQEPYRNQYNNRRQSVDALLNRLHPEQLAVLEHVATNMANSQMHAQM